MSMKGGRMINEERAQWIATGVLAHPRRTRRSVIVYLVALLPSGSLASRLFGYETGGRCPHRSTRRDCGDRWWSLWNAANTQHIRNEHDAARRPYRATQ